MPACMFDGHGTRQTAFLGHEVCDPATAACWSAAVHGQQRGRGQVVAWPPLSSHLFPALSDEVHRVEKHLQLLLGP